MAKSIKTRLQNKTDTSANWTIAGNNGFIPLKGEFIVYSDIGFKIGDGTKNINNLPMIGLANNITIGEGAGSIQQISDGVYNGFDFTNKNNNAIQLDPSLNGTIPYGATGEFASSFGGKGAAIGKRSFQIGSTTIAKGKYSLAGGCDSVALGEASSAFGYQVTAKGNYSAAIGMNTLAGGACSFAEGKNTIAGHESAHAEGEDNNAQGYASHVEGKENTATGDAEAGHAEGIGNIVQGAYGHAEGSYNIVSGISAHAQGENNIVEGSSSSASGIENKVLNRGAQAIGRGLITSKIHQIVLGQYNKPDSNAILIIGNGTGPEDSQRSNALVVYPDGRVVGNLINSDADSI